MERLPDEILSHILQYLNPREIVTTRLVCKRFLRLTRDNLLWKSICFNNSFNEKRRRRQLEFESRSPRYAALTRAFAALIGGNTSVHNANAPNAEMQGHFKAARERERALSNWDPSYPDEKINYYEEYIQRHASIRTNWFQTVKDGTGDEKAAREATGMGILYDQDGSRAEKLYGALDDGSVGVWQLCQDTDSALAGKLLARSEPALLCRPSYHPEGALPIEAARAMMTETGAVECVSIDNNTRRGYFASRNRLSEVDLGTLMLISREQYSFPITALSEARHPTPITVGTNMSLHLYDPRGPRNGGGVDSDVVRIERIGGPARNDFHRLLIGDRPKVASLPQPGPLSILHMPEDRAWDGNGDIWVAGRFTHLLNYDRRWFPRIRGTISSGARISCLRSRPQPFIPRELDQMRHNGLSISSIKEAKSIPGSTLVAAGEYKGKGSLEQYGLSSDPQYTTLSSDINTSTSFKNRQTASSSKLLSVANHGGKLVYSDGDGNIKWMERDGFTPIRSWNLNNDESIDASTTMLTEFFSIPNRPPQHHAYSQAFQEAAPPPDDIVQLLLPTMPNSTAGHKTLGDDNLVIWTGEGKLGLLGFGKEKWNWSELEEQALDYEEMRRRNEEREYAGMMGRALRRQQDELNFVRNFGLGI